MRKCVWIFLLAVLIPSAVLGFLALRSAEEQKIILERRTAELYQRETESLAAAARALIEEQRREFTDAVHQILAKDTPTVAAQNFSARIGEVWSRKAVGFSVGKDGRLLSPAPRAAAAKPEWQRFIWDNGSFLGGNIAASVYNVPVDALNQTDQLRRGKVAYNESDWSNGKLQVTLKGQAAPAPTPEAARDKEVQYAMQKKQALRVPEEKESKDVLQMQMRFGTPAGGAGGDRDAPSQKEPEKHLDSTLADEKATKEEMTSGVDETKAKRAASPPLQRGSRAVPGEAPMEQAPAQKPAPPSGAAVNAPVPPPAPAAPAAPLPSGAITPDGPASTVARRRVEPLGTNGAPPSDPASSSPVQAPAFGGGVGGSSGANPVPTQGIQRQADRGTVDVSRRADASQNMYRQVQPQQLWEPVERAVVSNIAPETASFSMLCAGASEGVLTRFVQDKLTLIFWIRPPQAVDLIFGCVIDAEELQDLWARIMPTHADERGYKPEFVLALLDDKAHPVTTSPVQESSRDWKRPFVASEIGEALPHWEAALYLMNPEQLLESAAGLRRSVIFLIVAMLVAIAFGGWLVVADARRQLALAQQKTDFVSNVSHELKTPLTSIRMFAELMHGGKPETQAKAPQYLRIIMVEAERLTRLINNVLDFAKLERRQKRFDKKPIDLHAVIERTWESHELHLQESGFTTHWEAAAPPYPVVGDEDALAQVLVNLLSNAEKYSFERKEIDLHTYLEDHHVCVSVLDRGMGVPPGEERKIFEAFYRAHDSLSSGIQGSGLGLTLAQRLALEHDGEITYRSREGGGSAFTLRLPLARKAETCVGDV